MEILEKLFGGGARVRVMKLFLFNPTSSYDIGEVSSKTKTPRDNSRKETQGLNKMGFLKRKSGSWVLNPNFPYIEALESLFSTINPFRDVRVINKIQRCGKVQLLIISGIFISNNESRVDLLVVGESLKRGNLENIIKWIESDMGKEIRYTIFDTKDFIYRYSMYDKLIRDILDSHHEKIINKLNVA